MARINGVRTRSIALIALDKVLPASFASAAEVLHILHRHLRNRLSSVLPGAPAQQGKVLLRVLSLDGGPVSSVGKFHIDVQDSIENSDQQFDAVILPAFEIGNESVWRKRFPGYAGLCEWLRHQRDGGAVFAAHCGGICLLAEAGLLDGHEATIPIAIEESFRRRYPQVRLDMSRSIVMDRDTICAAAVADNHRMIWRLLEHFRPGVLSEQTALDLFFHDPGMVWPEIGRMPRQDELGMPLVNHAKHWLARNHAGKLDLESLAKELAVSQRTLFRRFKDATGLTPNSYLQRLRVDTAKAMLQRTDASIEKVAARVGYSNAAYFCKIFRRFTGVTPLGFRSRSRR